MCVVGLRVGLYKAGAKIQPLGYVKMVPNRSQDDVEIFSEDFTTNLLLSLKTKDFGKSSCFY